MGCSEPVPDLGAAKRSVRAGALRRRAAMGADARAKASEAICARLLALPELRAARTVMAFYPFGDEVDLAPALRAILADGRRLALPLVDPQRQEIAPRLVADLGRDCAPGHRGIREPKAGCPAADPAEIGLVAVPAVAVDEDLNRLGYGGGFYDRFLGSAPQALKVGIVFETQRERRVPTGTHDVPVDRCLTEAGDYRRPT